MKGFRTRDFKRAGNATICIEIHKWARVHAAFIVYINIEFISLCLQCGINAGFFLFHFFLLLLPFLLLSLVPLLRLFLHFLMLCFPPSLSFPPTFHSPPFALILYLSPSASSLHPPPAFPCLFSPSAPFSSSSVSSFFPLSLFYPPVSLLDSLLLWHPSSSILLQHNLLFLLVFLCFFLPSFLFFFSSLIVFPLLFRSSFCFLFSSACFLSFFFSPCLPPSPSPSHPAFVSSMFVLSLFLSFSSSG